MSIDNRTCFQVNLRDGLRCRACGRAPVAQANYHHGFDYHHVVPRSRGGDEVVENLVLLCKSCHDQHHAGKRDLHLGLQTLPPAIACRACGEPIDPKTGEISCGWYRCSRCATRVHLFEHFGLEASAGEDA